MCILSSPQVLMGSWMWLHGMSSGRVHGLGPESGWGSGDEMRGRIMTWSEPEPWPAPVWWGAYCPGNRRPAVFSPQSMLLKQWMLCIMCNGLHLQCRGGQHRSPLSTLEHSPGTLYRHRHRQITGRLLQPSTEKKSEIGITVQSKNQTSTIFNLFWSNFNIKKQDSRIGGR